MKTRTVPIFFLAAFFSGNVLAAEMMTLKRCIDIAFENSKLIKIAVENVTYASGLKREAFGKFLPSLSAKAAYTRLGEVPSIGGLEMGNAKSYNGTMMLSQPLFAWGKIYGGYKVAGLRHSAAEEDKIAAEKDLLLNVKKSFYGVLLAADMKKIAGETYDVMKEHYDVTQKLYKEGKVSGLDVSRVKVEMVNSECSLIKADSELSLAKKALMNLINYKPGGGWEPEGSLEDYKPLQSGGLKELVKSALSKRPELKKAAINEDMMKRLLKITKAGNRPSLVLAGNWYYEKPYNYFEDRWGKNWNTVVSVNFPIFDGLSDSGRIKQASARLDQSRYSKGMLEDRIRLEVEEAFLKKKNALKRLEAQEENVRAAKENLKAIRTRYGRGLVSDMELRDTQLALSRSEMEYSTALYDLDTAQAELDRAVGE